SDLILEVRAVILHVSVRVVAVISAGSAAKIRQQSLRSADRGNQAVRVWIAQQVLRIDTVAALAGRPGSSGRKSRQIAGTGHDRVEDAIARAQDEFLRKLERNAETRREIGVHRI